MKTLLTLQELLSSTKGSLVRDVKDCYFTSVCTDSRQVCKDSMFVPLVGEFQNGHKYIQQAVDSGASVVLLNNDEFKSGSEKYLQLASEYEKVAFVCVENTLHGLQDAAETYVQKFPELVKISVTGSSGKTTTKEMLVSVLKVRFGDSLVYTQGNFNSETGLPLSVFNIRENHKIGVFEMGMNRVDEIGEISKVLKSEYGIITNIGTAHIGILGSRENIAREKRKSFDYVSENGAVFVPAEDDYADFCTESVKGQVVKYGPTVSEEIGGVKFIKSEGLLGTRFILGRTEILLPLSGEYNFQNALGVIALASKLGLSEEEIKMGLESVCAVSGRMETGKRLLKSGKEIILIKDCYNANLDSMKKVIEFSSSLDKKLCFVLADMKELGDRSEESHKEIGKLLCSVKPETVFLVGPEMKYCYEECCSAVKALWYEDKTDAVFEEIAAKINDICSSDSVVLLKGSHSMSLEKLVPLFCQEENEGSEKSGGSK